MVSGAGQPPMRRSTAMKVCAGGSLLMGIALGGRLPIFLASDIGVSGHCAPSGAGLRTGMSAVGAASTGAANSATAKRSIVTLLSAPRFTTLWLDGEALAAPAGPLGVGVVEREAGGEIVLGPVHGRADQVEHRCAVDVELAAGRFDLLVERLLLGHVIDRVSEARTAAARGRQLDADRAAGCAGHQLGNARFRARSQRDRRGACAQFRFLVHSIPNSSRASSLIFDGSHGGSHTRLTTESRMPGTDITRSSTSCGIDSATGQCGVVSVMVMVASPSSLTSTS